MKRVLATMDVILSYASGMDYIACPVQECIYDTHVLSDIRVLVAKGACHFFAK